MAGWASTAGGESDVGDWMLILPVGATERTETAGEVLSRVISDAVGTKESLRISSSTSS